MSNFKIAVVGMGYVGLPLAVEFARKYPVVGFDIRKKRITELRQGVDSSMEVEKLHLKPVLRDMNILVHDARNGLFLTDDSRDLALANTYIVTVPTPTDRNNAPDLRPLVRASETVGSVISPGDIVIYESTVYPGATEEECVPVLEKVSGFVFNRDFFVGYSPERINPGDREHKVTNIRKITSGSTPETASSVDDLYLSVIHGGTHRASSIRVAEAAKVIENSQRDINIAFVNELALIFNRMGIDTNEVLDAAGTKWNFLPFRPGLVGGHCIGIDPYYLAYKARQYGYHPEVILAGRRLNDNMGRYVASEVIKLMISKGHRINGAKALMLGITFKENCPDIRNTRVVDIIRELKEYGIDVDVYDPWADAEEVRQEYGLHPLHSLDFGRDYDALVLAVAHEAFSRLDIRSFASNGHAVVYDVKGVLSQSVVDGRL